MKRNLQDLTPQEVLSLAIGIERSNYHSLKAFSQFFEGRDDYDIAFRFRELANEELDHEAALKRRYHEMFGEEAPETVDFDFEDGEKTALLNPFAGQDRSYFDKARKIYELALIGENRAREFYQKAAETVAQPELSLLFKQLAIMEDNHGGWLEEKLAKDGPMGSGG